tara:strand:+ start:6951 stop:9905 length:2955 start_codon:yes stop_codon:yes gene_type:complete
MTSQKENIYNPFTDKYSTMNKYGRRAKQIYKYLIDETGADADFVLPQGLSYNEDTGRFVKVKQQLDTTNTRRITYAQIKAQAIAKGGNNIGERISIIKKIIKSYAGKTIQVAKKYPNIDYDADWDDDDGEVEITINSVEMVEDNEIWDIPEKGKGWSKWWVSHRHFFMIDSDTDIFQEVQDHISKQFQAQVLILTMDKVGLPQTEFNQYFLDGVSHCLFTPIKEWGLNKLEEVKSKSAEKRYKAFNNKVNKYIETYKKGVPESDISAICNDLGIGIEIDLPSTLENGHKYIEIESQKKPVKKFKYINTRLNHLEANYSFYNGDYIEKTRRELIDIIQDCRKNDKFFLWKSGPDGLLQVKTAAGTYIRKDTSSYREIVNDFENQYNLRDYRIEHNTNKELSNFLQEAINPNLQVNFCEDEEYDSDEEDDYFVKKKCNHIDMKKAYTRGNECSHYQGYLGKITDFRKTDKIQGLGIYCITDIQYTDDKVKKLFDKMGNLHDGNAYPSPELEFYKSLGISFKILYGCWGSSFDMSFGDDYSKGMFEKDGGVSHYCKFYGCLMKLNHYDRYNFDCKDLELAQLNQYHNKECSIRWNYEGDEAMIEYPKKYVYHSSHIASFICSYSRITMMQQLLKFKDYDNIKAVVCDGIYYKNEDDLEISNLFQDKELKRLDFEGSREYVRAQYLDDAVENYYNDDDGSKKYCIPREREHNQFEVHEGAGGCGKTHYNLKDEGLVAPMFIAPSWKLARNKRTEYGCDSCVFFHLLDNDPDKWRKIERYYNTLIIDEVSMLSNEGKEKILKRFKNHKIIFCGDIGFQLPPIEGTEFKVDKLPVIKHTTNHRCKCLKLKKVLDLLRKRISSSSHDSMDFSKYKGIFNIDIINKDDIDYDVNDLIITRTNKNKDTYTEKYKHLEKYVVLENTRDYSNGEIIYSKPDKVRVEPRHAFTIHSIQGETATDKLFIDLNMMKSVRMLYTALSRAKYLNQIIFMR